jgi:hypothetical protein
MGPAANAINRLRVFGRLISAKDARPAIAEAALQYARMLIASARKCGWRMPGIYLRESLTASSQLRATRDDKIAAQSSGISVVRVRLLAFTVSAILIGVGGGLFAHFLGILNTETFYLSLTFTTLAMLVVGGIGSLTGAVTGVIAVTIVVEMLRLFEAGVAIGRISLRLPPYTEEIGLGVLVALTLIFRPNGLAGLQEIGEKASSLHTEIDRSKQCN